MESKRYFALLPLWLRTLPSAAISMSLLIPILVLTLHGAFFSPGSLFAGADTFFARGCAIAGLASLALLGAALLTAYKRPQPTLTLDESGLATPVISLPWSEVSEVRTRKCLGLPALCISTANDDALIRDAPLHLKIWYGVRRLLTGAPIVLPAVRELPLTDLCDLIAQYRTNAAARLGSAPFRIFIGADPLS
jgi:hypothetical protein